MEFENYLVLLCIGAFVAGFVDAVVGGGGLIQTPLGFILLPNLHVATVIGTLKIPSFTGTLMAAIMYLKNVVIQWKLLLVMMLLAIPSAYAGSALLSVVSNDFMKPLLLIVLTALAIYSFVKKDFGNHKDKSHSNLQQMVYAIIISITIGFYDGFIGPGTGIFFVMAFVSLLGFDFLQASANAKMVNLATNVGAISLFVIKGKIIWSIAIPMAVCNGLGGYLGAKVAIKRGNNFVRIFFRILMVLMILRFAWDVLFK